MATQERAACWECGRTFDEVPISPPPNYCPGCRKEPPVVIDLRQLRRDVVMPARPKYITCLDCGRSVTVRRRGSIPTHCRGGCKPSRLEAPNSASEADKAPKAAPKKNRPATESTESDESLGPADPWEGTKPGPVYLTDVTRSFR